MSGEMMLPSIIGVGLVMIAVLKLLVGRLFMQMDKQFSRLFEGQETLRRELAEFKLTAAREYVNRQECQSFRGLMQPGNGHGK